MTKQKQNTQLQLAERGENKMALRHYPKEIEELLKIWEPYKDKVKDGIMKDAPKEAIEAFEKFKKWAWEQGQQKDTYEIKKEK